MKKVCMFLVLCLMATFAYGQGKSDGILIVASGVDLDIGYYDSIYSATTFIKAELSGSPLVSQAEFRMKIRDESGEVVYTMEGELENGVVLYPMTSGQPCPVRGVTWSNYYLIMGPGLVKTTDVVIENFNYRGEIITLPNTGGEYVTKLIVMAVSPEGENLEEIRSDDECPIGTFPTDNPTIDRVILNPDEKKYLVIGKGIVSQII